MTRRKRTPPPSRPAGSAGGGSPTEGSPSFRIPASLQQLSALSASLARSADKPAEKKASEIVRAAQAHAQAALGLEAAFGESGRKGDAGHKERKPKTNKPLRWKTDQKLFPEEQTWVKPKAGGAVSGHATFMQRRYYEGQLQASEEARQSDGEEQRVDSPAEVNGGSAAPVQGLGSASPAVTRPLRVLMDGRVASFSPSNGTTSTTMGQALWGGGGDDSNDGGPRKKRRIEFVGRHQPDFPDSQIWVQAKPRGTVVRSYGGEIEARRQAIIAQLKQTHSPVAIIGAEGEADGRVGVNAVAVGTPTPAPRPPLPPQLANAMRPIPMGTPQRDTTNPAGSENANLSGGRGGTMECSPSQQSDIAALIARKRAQNEASGQMQRLLGLRSEHQRKVMEQQQGISNGAFLASPAAHVPHQQQHQQHQNHGHQQQRMHGAGPLLAPRPSMPAQMPDLPPFPAASGGGQEVSDEDAPGEEDTPPVSALLPPAPISASASASASAPASAVVASAVPHALNTDPGDLRSLFSSPGPSPTPRPDISLGQRGGQTEKAGAEAEEMVGNEGGDGAVSPSVQLLMALANASPPPTVAAPSSEMGMGESGPASGTHRRTRSGLV